MRTAAFAAATMQHSPASPRPVGVGATYTGEPNIVTGIDGKGPAMPIQAAVNALLGALDAQNIYFEVTGMQLDTTAKTLWLPLDVTVYTTQAAFDAARATTDQVAQGLGWTGSGTYGFPANVVVSPAKAGDTSSSSTMLWVLAAVAAAGLGVIAARASKGGYGKKNPVSGSGPRLLPGYAFEHRSFTWKYGPDDDWEQVVIDEADIDGAHFLGTRKIDGTEHSVFSAIHGQEDRSGNRYLAQMSHMVGKDAPRPASTDRLDEFTIAYIECALWSTNDESTDSGGEPFDANYDIDDIAPATLAEMAKDCATFQEYAAADLAESGLDDAHAGHNFWLTREGHGTGFWDRGLGEVGDKLTKEAQGYGTYNLYLGDDGKIHGSDG